MEIIKRKWTIRETILVLARPGDPELVELVLSPDWILDLKFPGNRKFRFIRECPTVAPGLAIGARFGSA